MGYQIVPMDRSHLEQIAALEQVCFSDPWSRMALEEELYNPHASFIVAEDENAVVMGYAGLHAVLDEGYIANIAVSPQHRRLGIASALIETYCRFAAAHLAFLTLEVRASNAAAIALYTRHDFVQSGRRKNYYDNPKEDAILMERKFDQNEK